MLQSWDAGLKVHKPWRIGAGIIARMIHCSRFLSAHLRLGPDALRPRVFAIREVIRQACENRNVPFIDIWPTLADANGNFQYSLIAPGGKTVTLRTRDGVHIAPAGNKILAKAVLPHLERMLTTSQTEMPTPLPEPV